MALRIFNVPMAAVNMICADSVFFAASAGFGDDVDKRREVSFCAHTILQGATMVVPDATHDDRFHDNPLVSGTTNIRFYAGVPLLSAEGHAIGVLCILDTVPYDGFGTEDRVRLSDLAHMVMDRLEIALDASLGRTAVPKRVVGPEHLAHLAQIDALTGLPNRRQFYRAVEAALLCGRACGLLMVDVDGFKDINNILGTAAGDDALRAIGQLLVAEASGGTAVARVGGDGAPWPGGGLRAAGRGGTGRGPAGLLNVARRLAAYPSLTADARRRWLRTLLRFPQAAMEHQRRVPLRAVS